MVKLDNFYCVLRKLFFFPVDEQIPASLFIKRRQSLKSLKSERKKVDMHALNELFYYQEHVIVVIISSSLQPNLFLSRFSTLAIVNIIFHVKLNVLQFIHILLHCSAYWLDCVFVMFIPCQHISVSPTWAAILLVL